MRRTFKAVVEVTAEVEPGSKYSSQDLVDDIRTTVFTAVTEDSPLDGVVYSLTPVEEEREKPNVDTIEGRITLGGRTSQFTIQKGYGWQQWGETREVLGQRVAVVEAMVQGLADDEQFREDEEDDAADG